MNGRLGRARDCDGHAPKRIDRLHEHRLGPGSLVPPGHELGEDGDSDLFLAQRAEVEPGGAADAGERLLVEPTLAEGTKDDPRPAGAGDEPDVAGTGCQRGREGVLVSMAHDRDDDRIRSLTEVGRRTDVVGIFPVDASLNRLAHSLVIEQNDEWLVGRGYLSLEREQRGGCLARRGTSRRRAWRDRGSR